MVKLTGSATPIVLALVLIVGLSTGHPQVGELACGAGITNSVTLTKDLTCSGDALRVEADGVTVDLGGHTITGPGKGGWTWPGRATTSVGVRVANRTGVVVRNGRVTNFATGVLLEGARQVSVQGVAAVANHYGIYLFRSTGNRVTGVEINGNIYGLHLMDSEQNQITGSLITLTGHRSPGGYGVNLYSSSKNVLTLNTIERNDNIGIWIINSSDNQIFRNNIVDNHPNAVDETGANTWHDPATKQGNYWSDYKGRESGSPGIGRAAYRLGGFGGGHDPFPFLERDGWVKKRGGG